MLRKEEKTIFEAFIKLKPDFAGRPVNWQPGNDPPDILCIDGNGARIGVELGEWLNQGQIQTEKEAEVAEKGFRDVLRGDKLPHPANFGYVWIGRKPYARIKTEDAAAFKSEMYALTQEINDGWAKNPNVNGPQGLAHSDFSRYPTLQKYIQTLRFIPTGVMNPPKGIPWISFPARGGAYSSQSAVDALAALVQKKTAKYDGLHAQENLNELHLIAYYDKGLFYNSPYTTLGFGFDEIANLCREWIRANPGKFQKVFLFDSTGDGKIAEISLNRPPPRTRCQLGDGREPHLTGKRVKPSFATN